MFGARFQNVLTPTLCLSAEGEPAGGTRKGSGQRLALLQNHRGQNGGGQKGSGDAARLCQQGAGGHPATCPGGDADAAQVGEMRPGGGGGRGLMRVPSHLSGCMTVISTCDIVSYLLRVLSSVLPYV